MPTKRFNFSRNIELVKNKYLIGNIVLNSDSTIILDSSCSLKNVLVFAKVIIIKSGFQGTCQLFATDSVSIEKNCVFNYPSCIAVLRFVSSAINSPVKIAIGENTVLNGIIFNYDASKNAIKPIIIMGKHTKIHGAVYSQGNLELKDSVNISGSVFSGSFIYKSPYALYDNYLVNVTIDSRALSKYFLTSELLPINKKRKKVLQWLEAN